MKALIITGGSIDIDFAKNYIKSQKWDYVISADSGMNFCKKADFLPDLLLGDFDSADAETLSYYRTHCPQRMQTFPAKKDETDTELAILKAIEKKADEITVLGATGSRLDHVLGNIQLLKMALDAKVDCLLVDAHNRIRMIDGSLQLNRDTQFGRYVSLIPFTPQVEGLSLHGFAYELDDFTLKSGNARGISNEIAAEQAFIQLKKGILLVIESDD
jgi:thiamine pyrophosphokinase